MQHPRSLTRTLPPCLAWLGILLLALGLSACGGGSVPGAAPGPQDDPDPNLAGVKYRLLPLSLHGATEGFVEPKGINAKGQIAGHMVLANGRKRAFMFDGSVMHDLGTLGGAESWAVAINPDGLVIGTAHNAKGQAHAFAHDGATMYQLILPGALESEALAINRRGEVVGSATLGPNHTVALHAQVLTNSAPYPGAAISALTNPLCQAYSGVDINDHGSILLECDLKNDAGTRGFLRAKGVTTFLDAPGSAVVDPIAMNNAGQIVGLADSDQTLAVHGFLYENGQFLSIEPPDVVFTMAFAINEAGQVMGIYIADEDLRGYVRQRDGGIHDLGALGGGLTSPAAINAHGHVVGRSPLAKGDHPLESVSDRAFVWGAEVGMIDLNTRLHAPPPGLVLLGAYAISDNGRIVANSNQGLMLLQPVK